MFNIIKIQHLHQWGVCGRSSMMQLSKQSPVVVPQASHHLCGSLVDDQLKCSVKRAEECQEQEAQHIEGQRTEQQQWMHQTTENLPTTWMKKWRRKQYSVDLRKVLLNWVHMCVCAVETDNKWCALRQERQSVTAWVEAVVNQHWFSQEWNWDYVWTTKGTKWRWHQSNQDEEHWNELKKTLQQSRKTQWRWNEETQWWSRRKVVKTKLKCV